MNSRISPAREPQILYIFSLLAFAEMILAGVVSLLISPDPKNAVLLGFSLQRLVLVAGIWVLAGILLAASTQAYRRRVALDAIWLVQKNVHLRWIVYAVSWAVILWGWLSLACPSYLFGRASFFYERLRPFSVAAGLSLLQYWLLFLFARERLDFRPGVKIAFRKYFKPSLIFAIVLTGVGIFIAVSKFGLVGNLYYWNVPGIPLSSLQLFFILLAVVLWIAFIPKPEENAPLLKAIKKYRLIPILIFITAVLAWGLTPLKKHFFSLEPLAPSYQPFPYSDARLHDLGGLSVQRGYGIYFYGYTDKPLYMVFLAVLHFVAGNDYILLTWLQILVLALTPVLIYSLGEKFHGTSFGLFLSLVLIVRQRNAILTSSAISSVNVKLLATEEITLLGIILFACLVFLWMRDQKIWLALLCGACIGAVSLFRLNPLFLFPAIVCLITPVFWKLGKKILASHLSLYTLGFLIVFIPWIITGVNPAGEPWLLIKLKDVIHSRYGDITVPSPTGTHLALSHAAIIATGWESAPDFSSQIIIPKGSTADRYSDKAPLSQGMREGAADSGIVYRFFDHLLHNFSTSLLPLPDSLVYDDLSHLSQREYWVDENNWQGNLPPVRTALVCINVLLIAAGLGYAWKRFRWAGMIPLVIFMGYSFALAAAMNSGGRYLVPMDWTFYFYYGLAIVAFLEFVYKVMSGKAQNTSKPKDAWQPRPVPQRRAMTFSVVAVVCLASLIPAANLVLPALTAPARHADELEAARGISIIQQQVSGNILYGEILYPYYSEKGSFEFDLMMPQGSMSYSTSQNPIPSVLLKGGEHAFVVLHEGSDGTPRVDAIYLNQATGPSLIWKAGP